jgi:hypothetical protein
MSIKSNTVDIAEIVPAQDSRSFFIVVATRKNKKIACNESDCN